MTVSLEQQFDRIDADLNSLLEELKNYTHIELNKKPDPDTWSALQNMHHLMLAEGYALKYLQKKLSFNPELKKVGVMSKMRSLLLTTYLTVPLKFKAPEGISGDNLPVESSFWEVAKQWKLQRAELRAFLKTLPPEIFSKEVYKHPVSGRMSIKGMLDFFEVHLKRHKKQIRRALY